MVIKLLTFVSLCAYVLTCDYHCSEHAALLLAKRSYYEFSIKMLQRVTEDTDSHFVYSPLSTWLELSALAEGATGATWKELWNVTKHHKNRCFRKKLGNTLNKLRRDLSNESERQMVIAMDSLMGVKTNYIRKIQKLYGIKVMLLDFMDKIKSAAAVNNVIEQSTGMKIDNIVYYDDFISTMLLISDANYFKSRWKIRFNSAYPKLQPFYATKGHKLGVVNMMNLVDYFHLADLPFLGARVLEIQCEPPRILMLVFLPTNKLWIRELFYRLQRTRLSAIFNEYQRISTVLVNVTMPIFKVRTEVGNLAEIIYNMGIKRIFHPDQANLNDISDHKIFASLMTQITDIEINENGKEDNDFIDYNDTAIEFLVNKPFAYMIVDRGTNFILFAGVYSKPTVV